MEAVVHASGTLPHKSASLQNPSRSSRRDGSFQIEGGMLSRPGDLEEFRDLRTRSSSEESKGSRNFSTDGEGFRDLLIEERTGEIRSGRIGTKKGFEVLKPNVQTFFGPST